MNFQIEWTMTIRADPGSTVMESGPWSGRIETEDGGEKTAAQVITRQFYETMCRELGLEMPRIHFD